jgi:hypothetical protein
MNQYAELVSIVLDKVNSAKDVIAISNDINDLDRINKVVIQNPGYFVHFNGLYQKIKMIKIAQDAELDKIEAKLFCKFKNNGTDKAPSDKLVQSMVTNDDEYQEQKQLVGKLEMCESGLKGILTGLDVQLQALQIMSNNLRAERKTV